jgi:hypothetical protein
LQPPRRSSSSTSLPPQVRLDLHLALSSSLSRSRVGWVFTSCFLLVFLFFVDLCARIGFGKPVCPVKYVCLAKSPIPCPHPVASKAKLPTG